MILGYTSKPWLPIIYRVDKKPDCFSEAITLRGLLVKRCVVCQKFPNFSRNNGIICIWVSLNIFAIDSGGGRVPGVRGIDYLAPFPSPHLPLVVKALEVSPLKPSYGFGERCKLPQLGLGQSPSRQRLWCILRTWKRY